MSLLLHLFTHFVGAKIHSEEINEGPCLVWKCPRCLEARIFNLVITPVDIAYPLVKQKHPTTLLDLRCAHCGYELAVSPEEKTLLNQARAATVRVAERTLNSEEYEKTLRALDARFIKDLIGLTENWNCAQCKEENPTNFDSCWNCGMKQPGDKARIKDVGTAFPNINPGGNPWENP